MNLSDRYQTNSFEVTSMLVLSTAHITLEVGMSASDAWPGIIIYPKEEFGLFMVVPPDDEDLDESVPECLIDIIHLAQRIGAEWVMIDCDGPIVPHLRSYDW